MNSRNQNFSHLEDFCGDIIAKAQGGLQMTNRQLADRSGVEVTEIKELKSGNGSKLSAEKIAATLGLEPNRLVVSLAQSWLPKKSAVSGLNSFVTEFRSMTVNAYLYETDNHCILFDTGVDAQPICRYLSESKKSLDAIFLTHAHPDHVAALPNLVKAYPDISVFIHPREGFRHGKPIEWGQEIRIGELVAKTIQTPGHTPGGTSFLIENRNQLICFVGDAIFAGSVGGCAADYSNALQNIRQNLLSLPGETTLCPGHGPVTTVAEERANNPFFPGS